MTCVRVVFVRLFAFVFCISLFGCDVIVEPIYKSINNSTTLNGPAHFTYKKGERHPLKREPGAEYAGEVNANGYLFSLEKGGARFEEMELLLDESLPAFLNDIWVQIRYGEKTKLAILTPQLLKEHGYAETSSDDKTRGSSYFINNSGASVFGTRT